MYKKINIFQSNYYSFIENKDDIKYEKNNKFESYNSNQILNMYDFFHEPELIIQEGYYPDNFFNFDKFNFYLIIIKK